MNMILRPAILLVQLKILRIQKFLSITHNEKRHGANRNQQAFRTLKLLEQHHEKLAQLLKFRDSHPVSQLVEVGPEHKSIPQTPSPTPRGKASEGSPYRSQQPNPSIPHIPQRDISSSIASNLASARGIPSNKQRRGSPASSLSSYPQEGKILSPQKGSKLGEANPRARQTLLPETPQNVQKPKPSSPNRTASNLDAQSVQTVQGVLTTSRTDEPFQRFYATFEGLFSKLSAPLAFAGLPLNPEEPQAQVQPSKSNSNVNPAKPEERAIAEPDFGKIYSKAALRAVRDEHGGPHGGPFGGAESFYVVPTTGGTISYADILARAQQEATRQNSTENNDDQLDDEFVDARETPQPLSPVISRRPKPGTKTMEELTLENEALRTLADHVSRRLVEFEMGAQTSSLALQRSIRAMQSPALSDVGGGGRDHDGRVGMLEEQVRAAEREVERIGRENEKLKGVVGRYRERWEKLKEGARVRREGTSEGG